MTLLGHDAAWEDWHRALGGERMHHAWLLTGPRGVGKATFASAAALELVGGSIEANAHPDIHVLSYEPKDDKEARKRADGKPYERARSIRIAQIRAMQGRLTTRPTLGDKRAIVIDPADDLERNAANALLKSLEEPPQGTYFLLVSHSPARLLPTIRSRCRVLRFPTIPDEQIDQLLREAVPHTDADTRAGAVAAAAGSPGSALSFVEMDLGKVAKSMREIVEDRDVDFSNRGKLSALIGARPDRDRLQAVLQLARSVVAERAYATLGNSRSAMDAHSELVRLSAEQPTFNFDPGLLAMEIGTLLAKAGAASEQTDA